MAKNKTSAGKPTPSRTGAKSTGPAKPAVTKPATRHSANTKKPSIIEGEAKRVPPKAAAASLSAAKPASPTTAEPVARAAPTHRAGGAKAAYAIGQATCDRHTIGRRAGPSSATSSKVERPAVRKPLRNLPYRLPSQRLPHPHRPRPVPRRQRTSSSGFGKLALAALCGAILALLGQWLLSGMTVTGRGRHRSRQSGTTPRCARSRNRLNRPAPIDEARVETLIQQQLTASLAELPDTGVDASGATEALATVQAALTATTNRLDTLEGAEQARTTTARPVRPGRLIGRRGRSGRTDRPIDHG